MVLLNCSAADEEQKAQTPQFNTNACEYSKRSTAEVLAAVVTGTCAMKLRRLDAAGGPTIRAARGRFGVEVELRAERKRWGIARESGPESALGI